MEKLKLYNTLTRQKEEFKPLGKTVRIYTCGPTVYDYAHIGNLRAYIAADTLRRTLVLNGYKVRWVMNITDVDDKTIKKTIEEFGPKATVENLKTYTKRFTELFKENLRELNIPPEEIELIIVSEKIEAIKKFIGELLEKGYAYRAPDGSTYFSIERYEKDFGDYGALVGENFLKGKKVGARVQVDEYEKENLSDFALWKAKLENDGNIFWDGGELGNGRPGWHIECSVINHEAFGSTTDIHTGGVDLIFPHHTNEIAQSQPFYKPFVNFWVHNEHLLVDDKKMAKRDNNFYTLEDIKKWKFHPLAFRYLMLTASYRSKINFTKGSLDAAQSGFEYLCKKRFEESIQELPLNDKGWGTEFLECINEDLNTAEALARLHEVVGFKDSIKIANKMAETLGLHFVNFEKSVSEIPLEIKPIFDEYQASRANKQFVQSDELRKKLHALGYSVQDNPDGSSVIRKTGI